MHEECQQEGTQSSYEADPLTSIKNRIVICQIYDTDLPK